MMAGYIMFSSSSSHQRAVLIANKWRSASGSASILLRYSRSPQIKIYSFILPNKRKIHRFLTTCRYICFCSMQVDLNTATGNHAIMYTNFWSSGFIDSRDETSGTTKNRYIDPGRILL